MYNMLDMLNLSPHIIKFRYNFNICNFVETSVMNLSVHRIQIIDLD